MKRPLSLGASILALASAAHSAETGCMTPHDLSWHPSLVHHFATIDTEGKGCVTAEQVARYLSAMRRDKAEQSARIKSALSAGKVAQ